jgi:hypothetical protein
MEIGEVIYLGDGLYAKFDGYHIEVYSWDGIKSNDRVFLDSSVRQALRKLIDSVDVRDNHGEV